MKIEEVTNNDAVGIWVNQVVVTNDDGSQVAYPKSVYDTLPSESSIPTTPQAGE